MGNIMKATKDRVNKGMHTRTSFQILKEELGEHSALESYYSEEGTEANSVTILEARDLNYEDIVNYSTVGMAYYDYGHKYQTEDGKEQSLRIEYLGKVYKGQDKYKNLLSASAFDNIIGGYTPGNGVVHEGIVEWYYPESGMKHLLAIPPFSNEGLQLREGLGCKIMWLQLIPISDKEYQYMKEEGFGALIDKISESKADIIDIQRESTI